MNNVLFTDCVHLDVVRLTKAQIAQHDKLQLYLRREGRVCAPPQLTAKTEDNCGEDHIALHNLQST